MKAIRILSLPFIIALIFSSCGHSGKKTDASSADTSKYPKFNFDYKVLKKIKIGGEGGWDYAAFDSVNRRLYLSHSTQVEIVDVDKEQLIGTIPNTPGVHGIAFAYDLNKGYTSNGKDSSVTVFDLKTMQTLGKIQITGQNPDCIVYDPFTKQVFTFNGKSNNTTIIDAESGKVVSTIALIGKPEFAVTNGYGRIYVNIEDSNKIAVIDTKTKMINNYWDLDSGKEPSGMSYDLTYKRLFIGCGNQKLVIVNADNGQAKHSFPIGDHVDATAFNLDTKIIFSSNGDGTLTMVGQIDGDSSTKAVNIPTQKGARTLALDMKKDRIYLPVADFGPMQEAKEGKKPKPSIIPGTFSVLVVGRK